MGIDYGMGLSNIDSETGIRFGVISQNEILQAWSDASEPDYGEPACPKCGGSVVDYDDETHGDYLAGRDEGGYRSCADHACEQCEVYWESSEVYGDEPVGWVLDDGEYKASCGSDGDIFILSSPYFTRCGFCSPCAPGAGYLTDSGDDCRAYCFGSDWFDSENPCPYPIWRVDTGELVYSPAEESDE